ncbi:MAG: hypothetical protein Q4G47_02745 [Lachnospiraceae bacterium]|nr:hypothetical protein [Lachnospiraceae bacterium]
MAISLKKNKEGVGGFPGKPGGKKRITKFPDKTVINLVRFNTEKSYTTDILVILLIVVCLVAFMKFAVFDQMNALQAAQHQYSVVQSRLLELRQSNSVFDTVKTLYDKVTEWYMTDEEKAVIDKMDVLTMLEEDLMPFVELKSIAVSGSTVTVQTGQTTLEVVSEFLVKLQSDRRNRTATVTVNSVAGNDDNRNYVTSTVIIEFIGGSAAEEETAESTGTQENTASAAAAAENGGGA